MTDKKINLLFDVSSLHRFDQKDSSRSGIFWVTYNILLEFAMRDIFSISLYVGSHVYKSMRKMRRDDFFKKFKMIKISNKELFLYNIKEHKQKMNETTNLYKKLLFILKLIKNCSLLLKYEVFDKYKNKRLLSDIDIFFSPTESMQRELLIYKHIKKYAILYDVIPLVFPENYANFLTTNNHREEMAYLFNLNKEYHYFCISEYTKQDFIKYYNDIIDIKKMFVTYISTSQVFSHRYDKTQLSNTFKKYNIQYNENNSYIFSFCSLEPRKNLTFTIKCFIKFVKKHNINNLCFYLGGGAWAGFVAKLEESIDNFDMYRDKIVRLGYVDDEDVNILYSNSLFFTYISQYEGFGMPPLEAMQAGTPVITSNNTSLPEVVGDAAIMIDCDSEEQCIKAFEDLYFNSDLRAEYIKKGDERAKHFSWKKTADKMIDIMLEKNIP